MTRSEWDTHLATASDEVILYLVCDLPDEDILPEALYANSEICNGGFFQYYSNSIFNTTKHIADLRELGLDELANIVQRSLDCFPNSEQPIRQETDFNPISDRVLILIGTRERFDKLEEEYYRICDGVEAACIRYFRGHSGEYWKILGEER